MKEVLCLATGQTYDMVIATGITAHPAVAPYPRLKPIYLAPIKKGGQIEYIYRVKDIIECLPEDVYDYQDRLDAETFRTVVAYHEKRKESFGYGREATEYRFYILGEAEILNPPFVKKGIQIAACVSLTDVHMEKG